MFVYLLVLHMSVSRAVNKETKVKFVHTSVHGVGHSFVQSAFKAFDFVPPEAVPEQKDPDPEFPTVKYPNPEEGKGVLVTWLFFNYKIYLEYNSKLLLWSKISFSCVFIVPNKNVISSLEIYIY